ncbi:hypothetical protein AAVH_02978 [Aphelenchoides avenae]|nr:hypothetical protein AAVH_02978 [Aphelenchus avenae]
MIPEVEWEVLRFLRRIDLSKCQLLSKSHNEVVNRYGRVLALLPLRHVDIYEVSMKDSSSYVYIKFEPEHMAKPYVKKLGSACPERSYDELLKVFMRMRNTFMENLELRVESMQFFSEWSRIRAAIGPCRTRSVDLSRCKSPLMVDFAGNELGAKSFHFSVHRDLPLDLDAMLLKEPVKQADELVLSFQLCWCPIWSGLLAYVFNSASLRLLRLKFHNSEHKALVWLQDFFKEFQSRDDTSGMARRIDIDILEPQTDDDQSTLSWTDVIGMLRSVPAADGVKLSQDLQPPANSKFYVLDKPGRKQRLLLSTWDVPNVSFDKSSSTSNLCCCIQLLS